MVFVSGCLYQTLGFLQFYLDYPTTMEVSIEQQPVLMFPAVTICNVNRVRKTIWCSIDSSICNPEIGETQSEFITRVNKAYRLLNKTERITMGHTKSKLIQTCLFEGANCDDRVEQYFHHDYTNCFTVNARWSNKSREPLTAVMFHPRSGKPSDLFLLLNLESEEYTTELDEIVRAKMTIHSPDSLPNPEYDGVSLSPGIAYNYGVIQLTANVLPSPYKTNCKNYKGLKEKRTGATQTQEDCFSECAAALHIKYCACTVHKFSLIHNMKSCEKSEENKCLDSLDSQVKDFCRNECRMPCMKTIYKYQSVDSFKLRKTAFYLNDEFNRTSTEADRKNFLSLRVYYVSPDTEVYTHRPMFNGIQLFSVIGGYIGLWLGVSLLDIFGYLLKYACICTVKKEKKH